MGSSGVQVMRRHESSPPAARRPAGQSRSQACEKQSRTRGRAQPWVRDALDARMAYEGLPPPVPHRKTHATCGRALEQRQLRLSPASRPPRGPRTASATRCSPLATLTSISPSSVADAKATSAPSLTAAQAAPTDREVANRQPHLLVGSDKFTTSTQAMGLFQLTARWGADKPLAQPPQAHPWTQPAERCPAWP